MIRGKSFKSYSRVISSWMDDECCLRVRGADFWVIWLLDVSCRDFDDGAISQLSVSMLKIST